MKDKNKKKIPLIMFVLSFILVFSVVEMHGDNILGLDGKAYYDIYVGGTGDSLSIIRNVRILDLKEIHDMTFLVIETDSFGINNEGLISFDYIRAILPSHKIYIQNIKAVP